MKPILIAVSLAILLVLVGLLLRIRGASEARVEASSATAVTASEPASGGLSTAGKEEAVPVPSAESGRSVDPMRKQAGASNTAGGASRAAVEAESALPPMVDLASATETRAEGALTDAEREFYAKKYAGTTAYQRRLARQSIEGLLEAHKFGTEEKAQALSKEQAVSLAQEAAWLLDNGGA